MRPQVLPSPAAVPEARDAEVLRELLLVAPDEERGVLLADLEGGSLPRTAKAPAQTQ